MIRQRRASISKKKEKKLNLDPLLLSFKTTSQAAADALSRGEPVLLLDADATFDVSRLAAALRARFRHLGGSEEDSSKDSLVAAALSRFGLVTCHSALELLAALVTLRASLEELESRSASSSRGSQQKVRLVLLDNAAAFYWPLRASGTGSGGIRRQQQQQQQQQQQGLPPPLPPLPPPPQLTLATMAAASAAALRRALKCSGAAALVTRHAVFPASTPPPPPPTTTTKMATTKTTATATATATATKGPTTHRGFSEFFPASWLSLASRRADLALVASAQGVPRVRLTWRATMGGGGGGGGGANEAAAAPLPPPALFFELTDGGLVPL